MDRDDGEAVSKSKTLQAMHSSATPEHGTPPDIIEAARRVLGFIDLDPSSSPVFNENVKAERYFSKTRNGLMEEWSGRLFVNPPSGDRGGLVKAFWDKLMHHYAQREIQAAIWVGFSIDQLQTLQNTTFGGPLRFPICIPRQRIQFVKSMEQPAQQGLFGEGPIDSTPVLGESPTKPNFICFVPPVDEDWRGDRPCTDVFEREFAKFGEVRI